MLLGLWQGCRDWHDSEGVVADPVGRSVRYTAVSRGGMEVANSPVLEVNGPRPGLVGDVADEEDCRGDDGQEQKSEGASGEKG